MYSRGGGNGGNTYDKHTGDSIHSAPVNPLKNECNNNNFIITGIPGVPGNNGEHGYKGDQGGPGETGTVIYIFNLFSPTNVYYFVLCRPIPVCVKGVGYIVP